MTRVFGYIRVMKSAPQHADKQVASQQAALLNWSKINRSGLTEIIVEPYLDLRTPFDKRSEGRRLLGRIGPDDIVLADRFAHLFGTPEDSHRVLLVMRKKGCHVRCCDMGGGRVDVEASTMLLTALLAVSANTAYADSLRNKAIKKREANIGRYRGGHKIFGWDIGIGGALVVNAAEQSHIKQLLDLRALGATYKELEGYSIREGFKLTGPGILKILKRHGEGKSTE